MITLLANILLMADLQHFLFLTGGTTYLSWSTYLLLQHDSTQIAYTVFSHFESMLTSLLSQLNIEPYLLTLIGVS